MSRNAQTGMSDQERAADMVADLMSIVAGPILANANYVESTSARPEEVTTALRLRRLRQAVEQHDLSLLQGEPVDWLALAQQLAMAARSVANHVDLIACRRGSKMNKILTSDPPVEAGRSSFIL
jgi:hypothetical protein